MKVSTYLASHNVQWKFILKRAPWFGGFYERPIEINKNTLKKVSGRALVTLDELHTLAVQVEAVVNERPLTYVSSQTGEPQPLTPSMLLYGRSLTTLPYQSVTKEELDDPDYGVNQSTLNNRMTQLDILIQQCWKR